MRVIYFVICSLLITQMNLIAQSDSLADDKDYFYPSVFAERNDNQDIEIEQPQSPKYSVSSGFSMTNMYGQNYYNSWIMPSYNFYLNPKINVDLGIMFQRGNFPRSFYPVGEFAPEQDLRNKVYIVTSGTYEAGSKLLITGEYIGEIDDTDQNMKNFQDNYQHIRLGLQYQITPNIKFRADFIYENNNPYSHNYYSPYRQGYYYSPFGF